VLVWLGSSSEAAKIHDAAIAPVQCDLEANDASPSVIDEKPSAAVDGPNVAETAIANESLTIPTRDPSAIAEVGANIDIDRHGLGDGRQGQRRDH
jgi:hypothetical protein